jgi:hypothetical protein
MLPDAAQLLAKYSSLVLGDFDIAAHHTWYTRQRGTTNGIAGATSEKYYRKPSEFVQKLEGSMVVNGYNGSFAWEVREGEARIMTEPEAAAMQRSALFYDGVLPVPAAMTMTRGATVGEVSIGDDTAYAVTLAGASLAVAEAGGFPIAYLSKSTGLLASVVIGGGDKQFSIIQTFAAYRDFGGLLVPTELTIVNRMGTTELTMAFTIEEIRWDDVPDSAFELPMAVRSLAPQMN